MYYLHPPLRFCYVGLYRVIVVNGRGLRKFDITGQHHIHFPTKFRPLYCKNKDWLSDSCNANGLIINQRHAEITISLCNSSIAPRRSCPARGYMIYVCHGEPVPLVGCAHVYGTTLCVKVLDQAIVQDQRTDTRS